MVEWMAIAEPVTWILTLLYSLIIWLLTLGIIRKRVSPDRNNPPKKGVTVVIPFRNEKENLPEILNDLISQDYPVELLEIIFVNDHSTDGSADLLHSLIHAHGHIRCTDLPDERTGKKDALEYAVSQAQFDRIIQTDADCRVGVRFVRTHMNILKKQPADLVAGVVTTRQVQESDGRFLRAFERLDLLSLTGVGAGSFSYRRPLLCSGANLSYSRQLYHSTRAFDPKERVSSGDDMFLMIGARRLRKQMVFLTSSDAVVRTKPVKSPAELIRQRIRWGAKSRHYRMPDIQLVALLVALTNLIILISMVRLMIDSAAGECLPCIIALKTLTDFALLFRMTGITAQRPTLWWFLPVSLIYYFFFLLVVAGIISGAGLWKGRRLLR